MPSVRCGMELPSCAVWAGAMLNFAFTEFSEVRRASVARVFVLCFVFDDLQAIEHLEGEAHNAVILAQVLEVDGVVVVVDEHLVEHPAIVVKTLSPLGHGLMPYLARLLGHRRGLLIPLKL